MDKVVSQMTDLELCVHYVESNNGFVNPFLLRDVERRGLYRFINRLSGAKAEQKAQVYARFAQAGMVYGDPEIDAIAAAVREANRLKKLIGELPCEEASRMLELMAQLTGQLRDIQHYFSR